MKEVGKVGYTEGVVACDVGAQRPTARDRGVSRMATFILNAVNPPVDSSGLSRCCRHGFTGKMDGSKRGSRGNAGPSREMGVKPASVGKRGPSDSFSLASEGGRKGVGPTWWGKLRK